MNISERRIPIHYLMNTSGVRFGTSGARGRVADMSGEVCFAYTSAFLQAISATTGKVALGIDLRPSSPEIASACAAAVLHAGLSVDFCGALPTPALALYAQKEGFPAIMVTGSHIPFDRNGIKFYGTAGEISKNDEINICQAVVSVPDKPLVSNFPEINSCARKHYIDRYIRFFPSKCLAGMKLGFYEHSSVARDILRDILEQLGAEVVSLGRTDQFVPIDTEAVREIDIQQARDWAECYHFDAILSTDGDGDRPLLGDEYGHWFRGDVTAILCAQYLQARTVVTTVSCNTAAESCGVFDQVIRTRIGSPYVIEAIEELIRSGAQQVVGFEPNGGFLVGSSLEKNGRVLEPLLTRDAVLPILCLLSMAKENGVAVSELPRRLPSRFTASDRLQDFPTETSRQLVSDLAASPVAIHELLSGLCGKSTGVDLTDGLRIFLENNEIIHFRPSGNAPELRCYAESASQSRSEQLVQDGLLRMKARSEGKAY